MSFCGRSVESFPEQQLVIKPKKNPVNRKSTCTLAVELQDEYRGLINYLICMLSSFYWVLPNTISDKIYHTSLKPVYNGPVYSGHPVS